MPLPWKKKKVTRISNFVADLHSPPKRGSSLVVQTGFPTSLIDLFVKNRSRFKKPKPMRRAPREIHDPPPPPSPEPEPEPEPADLSACLLPRAEPTCPEALTSKRLLRNGDGGFTGSEPVHDRLGECIGGSDSDPNKVIPAILKMLVVLAVTFTVEKLTLGITISAFVLLFLEFAGKHVVSWFKPCSDANMAFQYLAQRVSGCDWFPDLLSVMGKRQNCEVLEPPSLDCEKIEVQLSSSSSTLNEIEIVEIKSETGTENRCDEEICFHRPELHLFYEHRKAAVGSEIEEVCEITQDKTKSKRSRKLKSKIAKKLRGLKKKNRAKDREETEKVSKEKEAESWSEVPSSAEGDELAISEIGEEGQEGIEELENWSKLECIEDEEVDFGITGSNQEVEEEEEKEKERIDRGGSSESGALMLFVVALAGLVVGRFAAFSLAVTWMFMLKIRFSRKITECTSYQVL
ncbi:hypothetical protein QN277_010093 [Acacia crassicarpa]|uniref:Ethylene-responsive nuclear protein n=1 Tax=Acacia crassicarpa TaxID=499986 RepID=A0AAE1IQG3_9FABA|nr:hypothetical protein QN277_010093 [Acacia crassicarpa]